MSTWVAGQYDLAISVWPLLAETYEAIRPPRGVSAAAELLSQALVVGGPPASATLDAAFADLAHQSVSRNRLWTLVVLPLRRAAGLWLSPFPSMA